MADLNKFEEMLERLVNEDKAGAEELFHEIVVEKSREIYENLLEDEDKEVDETTDEDKEVDEAADEEVDESDEDLDEAADEDEDDDDDKDVKEDFDLEEFEVEADDEPEMDPMMGGDPADDMMGGDEEGDDDMGGEGDMEDRVEDLEDALDELKAEFEKMMSDDEGGEEEAGDDMDMDMDDEEGDDDMEEPEEESYEFESTDEEVDEASDEEVDEADKSEAETMREYVEKVTATMGDNGANTKSAVAGKNDMGGTASNLNQAGTEAGVEANKGNLKGSALSDQNAKEDSAGNVNVPGGKASKSMKAQPKGHGAEKKGSGETGTNGTKSVIGQ
jgi:hypothetical protein